jgi:phenylalanyl-tRNA synthetase alpha chain
MNSELSQEIASIREKLLTKLAESKDQKSVLRSPELKSLYDRLPALPSDQKPHFGQAINGLKRELQSIIDAQADQLSEPGPIDVSAPFDVNTEPGKRPGLLPPEYGSTHPLMQELDIINSIFISMGFSVVGSREIDDDWHMFGSLNFPEGHPARDDYDTFMTVQTGKDNKPLLAPAHTSTMQNRVLRRFAGSLERNEPIAAVIPGRVFRNEDVDARHEHTFYQLEGVYVNRQVSIGNLMATLKAFLEQYYNRQLKVKTQPVYFPFTEPSLEFIISCPFCAAKGCRICSQSGWIELIGCGMIHPNVLAAAAIDSGVYQGFAWGCGIERLVMMKYAIEDIRLFESGRLDFLRQFSSLNGNGS